MVLMRGFSRFKGGKVAIPSNFVREADLKEGDLVEVKIQGQSKPNAQYIIIRKRRAAR